jgi:hypothetical protein
VTPAALASSPTKHGPGRALGMRYSPWQEPWWNAGRRARPTADGSAQADLIRGATAPAGAGLTTVRLPAFRFLISFFRSLPFLRHCRARPGNPCGEDVETKPRTGCVQPHISMDHRVKPGGDEDMRCCLTMWIGKTCAQKRVARTVLLILSRANGGLCDRRRHRCCEPFRTERVPALKTSASLAAFRWAHPPARPRA